MLQRVTGISSTFVGMSARNRWTWQSFDVQGFSGARLRASGTVWRPALAELCLNTTLLLFTEARSDCSLGLFECLPLLISSVASTTGLLSGKTSVGFVLSLIQCLT